MKPRMTRAMAAAVACLFVALAGPATTLAEPGGPDGANFELHFYDCTGPAGTPETFDVEFQVQGSAWHLTDSHQIFEGMIAFNETTNTQVLLTRGFELNAVPVVTCRTALNGSVYLVTGVLT